MAAVAHWSKNRRNQIILTVGKLCCSSTQRLTKVCRDSMLLQSWLWSTLDYHYLFSLFLVFISSDSSGFGIVFQSLSLLTRKFVGNEVCSFQDRKGTLWKPWIETEQKISMFIFGCVPIMGSRHGTFNDNFCRKTTEQLSASNVR